MGINSFAYLKDLFTRLPAAKIAQIKGFTPAAWPEGQSEGKGGRSGILNLGLPQSIKQFANTNQTILQYQVHQSTNVLGWNFPLEFYLVQYNPDGTKGWKAHITTKGQVTAIVKGSKIAVPPEDLSIVKIETRVAHTFGPTDRHSDRSSDALNQICSPFAKDGVAAQGLDIRLLASVPFLASPVSFRYVSLQPNT
jgi:hypothetical protein